VERAANSKSIDRGVVRRGAILLALGGLFALIVHAHLPLCPMAGVLGIPCPGCGLTRATLALLHGEVRLALHLHPLAPLIAPLFFGALASAALGYVRGPRPRGGAYASPNASAATPWLASRTATVFAILLLAATLGVWGARFLGYFGGPAPVQTFAAWITEARAASAR
jgi:hypothetical protein